MNSKKKTLKFISLWATFYIALLLIFKNQTLFSNEIIYEYNTTEIIVSDFHINDSTYSPLNENSKLQLELPAESINNIILNFKDKSIENNTFTIYSQDEYGEFIVKNRLQSNTGSKYVNIYFEDMYDQPLFIKTEKPITLSNIQILHKELNIIQNNPIWIISNIIVLISSFLLAVASTKISNRDRVDENSIKANSRSSNIEFLRIICMFLIVTHHCVVHGGLFNTNNIQNKIIAMFFLPVGKICFITFVAISMWFYIDKEFKATRFLCTWFEAFFYSFTFTIATLGLEGRFSIKELFSSLFPILGNSHGFASSYLLFYLCLPFIVIATKNLKKNQARYLLGILFLAQVLSQIMGYINNYYQPISSELTLFIFCYVLMLNIKKWPPNFMYNKKLLLYILSGIYILLLQGKYVVLFNKNNKIIEFIMLNSEKESSFLIIVAGVCLFLVFKDLKFKKSLLINRIASSTFAILLIHDHNFFRTYFWQNYIETSRWYSSKYFLLILIATTFMIFFICSIIDYLRKNFLEKSLMQTKVWKTLSDKWNAIF